MVGQFQRTKPETVDTSLYDPLGRAEGGTAARKLLRELAGVQMWQTEASSVRGVKWPVFQYEVVKGGVVKAFGRPHEAWEHFRTLTHAPNTPPEPPGPPAKLHERSRAS
jgi:hypothetical protein